MENTTIETQIESTSQATTAAQRVSNTAKKTSKRSSVPVDDINFAALSLRVATAWAAYPQVKLLHITQASFASKAAQLDALVQQRIAEQQSRPVTTISLKQLSTDARFGIKIVRSYLLERYKDEKKAAQHYLDFGLERKSNTWVLPVDQQRLLASLRTIKVSIVTYGFDAKDFGLQFWTDMEANYNAALQDSILHDGSSSTTVNQKDVLKKELKSIMTSLRLTIRANYPDTYTGILRNFGFQKEKA